MARRQDERVHNHTMGAHRSDVSRLMTKLFNKENRLDVVLQPGKYVIMREVQGLSQKLAERTVNNQYKMRRKSSETKKVYYISD